MVDGAPKLVERGVRMKHGQRGQPPEPPRVLPRELGVVVVGELRQGHARAPVVEEDARGVHGQHTDVHLVFVHLLQHEIRRPEGRILGPALHGGPPLGQRIAPLTQTRELGQVIGVGQVAMHVDSHGCSLPVARLAAIGSRREL